ncbi:hypothetical protein TorRG33x02_068420, partial [Trema orientale]
NFPSGSENDTDITSQTTRRDIDQKRRHTLPIYQAGQGLKGRADQVKMGSNIVAKLPRKEDRLGQISHHMLIRNPKQKIKGPRDSRPST